MLKETKQSGNCTFDLTKWFFVLLKMLSCGLTIR